MSFGGRNIKLGTFDTVNDAFNKYKNYNGNLKAGT